MLEFNYFQLLPMMPQDSDLQVRTKFIYDSLTHHTYFDSNTDVQKTCLITFAGIGLDNTKPRAEFIRSAREAGYSRIHAITDQSRSW